MSKSKGAELLLEDIMLFAYLRTVDVVAAVCLKVSQLCWNGTKHIVDLSLDLILHVLQSVLNTSIHHCKQVLKSPNHIYPLHIFKTAATQTQIHVSRLVSRHCNHKLQSQSTKDTSDCWNLAQAFEFGIARKILS